MKKLGKFNLKANIIPNGLKRISALQLIKVKFY